MAEQKREKLFEYIRSIDIVIPKLDKKVLYKKAINHYNYLWLSRGRDDKYASIDSDEKFLGRITVNMLRHEFSCYEEELYEIAGSVGVAEGYYLLRDKVQTEIAKVYPYLKDYCE